VLPTSAYSSEGKEIRVDEGHPFSHPTERVGTQPVEVPMRGTLRSMVNRFVRDEQALSVIEPILENSKRLGEAWRYRPSAYDIAAFTAGREHGDPYVLPNGRGLEAWAALLQAHATLMRRLEVDLAQATGLALADFDVLAQLAHAGGELRMTDLAARALISRSGMTRRVARLVDEGLVRRANADGDARSVVVALTDAGVARLTETAPVHLRGVSEMFVAQLDDQELAVLKNALDKVTVDCTFG